MVDKHGVREYIKDTIGEEYLIPLIGVWNNPDEIDFDTLPNLFVLKCNHNSGLGMCIRKDKATLDISKVKVELGKGLKQDYYLTGGREWPYKNVPRKITCEKYMSDGRSDLIDYKFYCFNGKPIYCQVIAGRTSYETMDFYDEKWKLQDFTRFDSSKTPFPHAVVKIDKPKSLSAMLRLATILSAGIPYVRVDFYEIDDRPYFGEMTFFPLSGFGEFTPAKYNEIFGDLISLPNNK